MNGFASYDDGLDALSRHLPYDLLVEDGVLLLDEDDALLSAIEYRGRDQACMDPAEVQDASAALANAVYHFGGGFTLHFEVQKRLAGGYPGTAPGAPPVSALIDAERRDRMAAGPQYRHRFLVAVRYAPPPAAERRVFRFFTRNPPRRARPDFYRDEVEPFMRAVRLFAGLLAGAAGEARVLGSDELVTYLHSCVSPVPQEVRAPVLPGFPVRAALADTGFTAGSFPRQGNGPGAPGWHLRVVGVLGYPALSHPGFLNALLGLECEYRLAIRFECMDPLEARRVFASLWRRHDDSTYDVRSMLLQLVTGTPQLRQDAVRVAEALEAEQARVEADAAGTSSGWLTPTAVVWGRTVAEAEHARDLVLRLFRAHGFACAEEGWNSDLAWLGSLPGHVRPNARKVPLPQATLADLVVLSSECPGQAWNPHLGCGPLALLGAPGGVPYGLSLHQGPDGCALVVGPPRSGKSTGLAFLAHQFLARVPGGRVVWLDVDARESTSMVATWAAGGQFVSFLGGGVSMQPLARVDEPDELAWCHGWVMDLLRAQGVMEKSAQSAADMGGLVTGALRLLAASPRHERTVSHLSALVQSAELRQALAPWCRGQPYGDMVDADRDSLSDSAWTTVDLGNLLERGPLAVPVFRALFRGFYRRFADGRPTLFVVDEAFRALRERPGDLEDMRRRGPKKNVSLVLATHLLEDVDGSPVAAMLRTIHTLVLLRDGNATRRDAYRQWGVNWSMARLVEEAAPRRDWLVVAPGGSRLAALELDPVALAVCGCGGAAARREAEAVMRAAGPAGFAAAWLRARGLADEADELEAGQGGGAPRAAAE